MKFLAVAALFTGLVAATPFGPAGYANYPSYDSYNNYQGGNNYQSSAAATSVQSRQSSAAASSSGTTARATSSTAARATSSGASSAASQTISGFGSRTSSSSAAAATVSCLTNTTATNLVNQFASLLTAYSNATADAYLSNNFTDTSDSINFLGGYPLGSVTFPSKDAFKSGQGSQPAIGFTVLAIDAIGCTTAAFRWSADLGAPDKVKGINVMYASNLNGTDAGWQIAKMYSEFNSAVWANDIGGSCTP